MAAPRSRPDSVRRARGLTVGECGKLQPLRRWDGLSRTCREWDSLRRDPEIWERNGNCLVHLYAKGHSKRGPSFKLPFTSLISAGCYPLIERFLVLEGFHARSAEDIERWDRLHPRSTVELYIPAPSLANEAQACQYHLATRNLMAWVLGRPMVGEQLGSALVGLSHSMHEFRSTAGSNMDDLTRYLLQAGYLNLAEEPGYALAILHLAETFQAKDLYAQAFPHCVGMHERLFGSPEYQLTTSASRKLIRKASLEMDAVILQTADMLTTFLDDELSESQLGVPAGSRAHLERFRSFLLSFYASKLGYYPPKHFSAGVLRNMAEDFKALYELMVDNGYTCSDNMPSSAVGGICIQQLVQTFDGHHKLQPLEHPLPRLPHVASQTALQRMSWLPFGDKLNANQRQVVHAALANATNWAEHNFKNDLVRAYRKFEEQSIVSPNKADKSEKVSVADARKVRWVMIYAVYQILRRATRKPAEMRHDETSYHLAVPMGSVPPWQGSNDMKTLLRHQTHLVIDTEPVNRRSDIGREKSPGKIEIKPDIDYLALTRKERQTSTSNMSDSPSPSLSRSSSFSISLRRNSTIRRSLRKLRPTSISESHPVTSPSKAMYHEIDVQDSGNATYDVTNEPDEGGLMMEVSIGGRSDSTASSQSKSSSSASADSALDSMSSTVEAPPLTITTPSPTSIVAKGSLELELMLARWGPQEKTPVRMSSLTRSTPITVVARKAPQNENAESDICANSVPKQAGEGITRRRLDPALSAAASLQRRHPKLPDLMRRRSGSECKSVPVRIREDDIDEEPWASRRNSDDWSVMQAFMDGTNAKVDIKDAWAHYADLGGLTDMRQ